MTLHDPQQLPGDLPAPPADGACDHLPGMEMPAISLAATNGSAIDLADLGDGRTVIYCYPRTGEPGKALPEGWDDIPGARGCTPQSCSFRDHSAELAELGARVYGLSTQDTAYQAEAAERLRLPFPLLSDAALEFSHAMRLPTFEASGMTLLKRLTLVVKENVIEHVFYPVFPPDESAATVLAWLKEPA